MAKKNRFGVGKDGQEKPFLPPFTGNGRDEMNLAEFPLALLQFQRNTEIKTVTFSDWIVGKDSIPVERRWTIAGSEVHGLPVAGDVDIVIALLVLAQEQGMKTREVLFTRYDLLRIMGLDLGGRSYERIKEGLDRLTGLTIKAVRAFFDKQEQAYLTRSFHLIDDYDLWDRAEHKGTSDPTRLSLKSVATWNRHIFKSLQAGYVKRLDTERYFRLKTPIAKQLFRYLDKKFHRQRNFQIEIFKLCHEHLGISRASRHVSKLKERLEPAMKELVKDGFLESYAYAPSAASRGSLIVQFVKSANAEHRAQPSVPASYFYHELHERVSPDYAIPPREQELADSFVRRHGLDTWREFVTFVMREKSIHWPGLATLTGAFSAFESPFLAQLEERQARQETLMRERREREQQRHWSEAYARYIEETRERVKEEKPERYAAFEKDAEAHPDYARAATTLKKLAGAEGPLAKAARDATEKEQRQLLNRLFVESFGEEGILEFETWRKREASTPQDALQPQEKPLSSPSEPDSHAA